MSVFVDRVYETTTTTGTGAITMAGAVLGYFTFAAKLANPSVVDYVIVDNATGDVEVGRGTWTTTLARDTVLSSSNGGAAVNFAAGTKQVFVTAAASSVPQLLAQNTYAQGTITTSQPQTFTQTWNNAGVTFVGLFANYTSTASGANSLLMDLQLGSVSMLSLNKSGDLLVKRIVSVGTSFNTSDLNGNTTIKGSSIFGIGSGNAGGVTDTGFKRNAAGVLEINDGNTGAAYRDMIARNLRTNATTVASLTAAATAGAGARSFVTDATATTFLSTVAGGGANKVPVVCDGTNWLIG